MTDKSSEHSTAAASSSSAHGFGNQFASDPHGSSQQHAQASAPQGDLSVEDLSSPKPASDSAPEEDLSPLDLVKEFVKSLFIAIILALLIKTFLIQAFYIPSGSMLETLQLGDRVLVEKVTYLASDPQRGDVIVFRHPQLQPDNPFDVSASFVSLLEGLGAIMPDADRDLIKRIVGVPGDTVVIRGGKTFINEVEITEPYVIPDVNSYGPYVIPQGHYFVMGDNRSNSLDSRFGLGTVPHENIIGKAWLIIWPYDRWTASMAYRYAELPVQ